MGAEGSNTAIEAADVALMSDDLTKVPWLIRHSRRTLVVIRQNIGLSLAVKAAFVALTFPGHASLWAAIGADRDPLDWGTRGELARCYLYSGEYQKGIDTGAQAGRDPRFGSDAF